MPIEIEGFEHVSRESSRQAVAATIRVLAARGVVPQPSAPRVRLMGGRYTEDGYEDYLRCDRDALDSGKGCAP